MILDFRNCKTVEDVNKVWEDLRSNKRERRMVKLLNAINSEPTSTVDKTGGTK